MPSIEDEQGRALADSARDAFQRIAQLPSGADEYPPLISLALIHWGADARPELLRVSCRMCSLLGAAARKNRRRWCLNGVRDVCCGRESGNESVEEPPWITTGYGGLMVHSQRLRRRLMSLKSDLERVYQQYGPTLGNYAWMSETDRWAELVFCLLQQCGGEDPALTRDAVAALQYLGLINIERLSTVANGDISSEDAILLAAILKRQGFSQEASQSAVSLLSHVARVLKEGYDGKVQRYLRKYGQAMVDELVNAFGTEALEEDRLRYAITYWLQNVLSMPVSLAHPAVIRCCEKHSASLDDLLACADELDLNITVVDDLLELAERFEREETPEAPI
jgi:hypothetical protein